MTDNVTYKNKSTNRNIDRSITAIVVTKTETVYTPIVDVEASSSLITTNGMMPCHCVALPEQAANDHRYSSINGQECTLFQSYYGKRPLRMRQQ
jgi:hypothetical protein